MFGDEAVVGQDDDGGGAVDEGDEEGADPVGVEAVACYLSLILIYPFFSTPRLLMVSVC